MPDLSHHPHNRLLLALPPRILKRLLPELESLNCPRELVLMEADSSLDYIFFPESGVISVLAVYTDGNLYGRPSHSGCENFLCETHRTDTWGCN